MPDKKEERFDLTEQASQRGEEEATGAARQAESDDLYSGGSGLNNTPSPEGDSAGENRVTTSLSDD